MLGSWKWSQILRPGTESAIFHQLNLWTFHIRIHESQVTIHWRLRSPSPIGKLVSLLFQSNNRQDICHWKLQRDMNVTWSWINAITFERIVGNIQWHHLPLFWRVSSFLFGMEWDGHLRMWWGKEHLTPEPSSPVDSENQLWVQS